MPLTPVVAAEEAPVDAPLADDLENVRVGLERSFTDAGVLLEQSLEVTESLIANLERLNGALDADAAQASIDDLTTVADQLAALPSAQTTQNNRLQTLVRANANLALQTEEMDEALRYLRAFALNVKVAGAEIALLDPEFAGFAQEMLDRIDHGAHQLDDMWAHIGALDGKLKQSRGVIDALMARANGILPHAPEHLKADAAAIGVHNAAVLETSAAVAEVARRIQMNVAMALSALQIGDTTRQRIEHVQLGLNLAAELEKSLIEQGAGREGSDAASAHLHALLATQMDDIATTFEDQAGRVVASATKLGVDTSEIVRLQSALARGDGGGGGLRDLERSVGQAMALVREMDAARSTAQHFQRETSAVAADLIGRVDAVRAVKDDIHFMALNTTLRSARIGERGRPIRVVAAELRTFAAKLDDAAERALEKLHDIAASAAALSAEAQEEDELSTRIDTALARLRTAAQIAETDLATANARGQAMIEVIKQTAGSLGFNRDFGDSLTKATQALRARARDADTSTVAGPLSATLAKLAKSYTMARERDIHSGFALDIVSNDLAPQPTASSDDIDAMFF